MRGILVILAVVVAAVSCGKQCPSEQETNWELELLLPHEDCDKFYKCTYGEPVTQLCPPGLLYNIGLEQCDWSNEVDCGDRNLPEEGDSEDTTDGAETEPEPVPEPESESEESVEPEQPESESEESTEPPQPESESDESEEPSQSESEEVVVPEQPESESEEVIQPESEESTQEPELEFLENGCPVSPFVHWLLPSQEDCNQFYYCVFGEKQPRQCSSSLHFNPVLQVCDFPWNAGCQLQFNKRVPVRPMLTSF
ncbi:peritrophin-1-like [Plodia interpunctella]|uniref:peritrophin-1-like n=1 Tax=Plodia interpunctella TaxID=58824 RepID=UPI002367A533|nr:peritrophin-1-like [Plodia interpunctella]